MAHQSQPSNFIWQSIPGQPFAEFHSGHADVSESRGFFKVKEQVTGPLFAHQVVERLETKNQAIRLFGQNRADAHSTVNGVRWILEIVAIDEAQVGFELTSNDESVNRCELIYRMSPTAPISGFGIQFTHLDMREKKVPILSQEPGIGRGIQPLTYLLDAAAGAGGKWHTTNASVPHYITQDLRSFCLENTEYSLFDFTRPGESKVTVHSGCLKARIFFGRTPLDHIEAYTRYSGRMHPLPDWIHSGAIIGMQGGTQSVNAMRERLGQHDTPIAAFWLQDWVGARRTSIGWQLWWNWEVDHERYPGWDRLVADLDSQDIRVLTYLNPFLVDPTEKGAYRRNLFAEAKGEGFLIRRENGEPYMILNTSFSAAMLDLANPEAGEWIKEVIKSELLASGASGWMADFGEALPFDACLHGDTDAAVFHNAYPVEWARLNREAIEEAGRLGDVAFFTRSGFSRSPQYSTLFWMGDQLTSWRREDGIKETIIALLSSGLSGYSFNHSDIGGYIATTAPRFPVKIPGLCYTRNKELLMRWIELNAFTLSFELTKAISQPSIGKLMQMMKPPLISPGLRGFTQRWVSTGRHCATKHRSEDIRSFVTRGFTFPMTRHLEHWTCNSCWERTLWWRLCWMLRWMPFAFICHPVIGFISGRGPCRVMVNKLVNSTLYRHPLRPRSFLSPRL